MQQYSINFNHKFFVHACANPTRYLRGMILEGYFIICDRCVDLIDAQLFTKTLRLKLNCKWINFANPVDPLSRYDPDLEV